MLKNYDDLSPVAIDCLREIGNIGSGSVESAIDAPPIFIFTTL